MMKNYYLLLGVTSDASDEEIKTAFRRRALELHPDRSGLESDPFLEIKEAYGVLADPKRRRHYDEERLAQPLIPRSGWRPSPEPLRPPRRRVEPLRPRETTGGFREVSLATSFDRYRPSFDELFDRWWSNFHAITRPKAEVLQSLTVEIVVNPEQALYGGTTRVGIPAQVICPTCGGGGAVGLHECWRCEGHGALTAEYPLDIEYPPQLPDGYAVRVPLARFGIENFYLTVLFRVSSWR